MVRALLVALLLLAPGAGLAHRNSRAAVELRVRGAEVQLDLRATAFDLGPLLEVAAAVRPLPELYQAKRDTVLRNAAAYLTVVLEDGPTCALRRKELRRADASAVELRLSFRCPRHPEDLELRYDLLFDDDPLHHAFATAPDEPGQPHALLSANQRTFRLRRQVSVWSHAAAYLRLGVEHIFTGYDHLCFLAGLLLCAAAAHGRRTRGRLLDLLAIVTAFTLAHSVTLVAAALDWLRLPARVVEPAIALSILYVGAENLLRPEPRRRWLLAFTFGLVHGFGFAHVLREVGLPQRGLLLSLFAFNGGVELGQLAVTALLFPVLLLAVGRAGRSSRLLYRAGSLAIALAGLFWAMQRLRGR
jgi:hydrogenase/urease accessory protein HupE